MRHWSQLKGGLSDWNRFREGDGHREAETEGELEKEERKAAEKQDKVRWTVRQPPVSP